MRVVAKSPSTGYARGSVNVMLGEWNLLVKMGWLEVLDFETERMGARTRARGFERVDSA